MNDRHNQTTKDWKERHKDWFKRYEGLRSGLMNTTGDEDGIFDSEANMVVKNQNDKLRKSQKLLNDAQGYGANTKSELERINDKLKGINSNVNNR